MTSCQKLVVYPVAECWRGRSKSCYDFSALMLLVGWHPAYKKTEWLDAGMVICPVQGARYQPVFWFFWLTSMFSYNEQCTHTARSKASIFL